MDYAWNPQKVKERRLRLGLTQGEVAERVGITRVFYNYMETGKHAPSARLVAKLATALRVRPDYFFR